MSKFMKEIGSVPSLILYALACAVGVIYGLLSAPFYLHFIDGLTYAAVFYTFCAIIRWQWKEGDFTIFSWRPFAKNTETYTNKSRNTGYNDYKENLRKERADASNVFRTPAIVLIIVVIILTFTY